MEMTLYRVCVFFLLVFSSVISEFPLKEETIEDYLKSADCNELDRCVSKEGPICASNGQNYESLCSLKRAQCEGKDVTFRRQGYCSITEECPLKRAAALEASKKDKGRIFVPGCREDGTFAAKQCHEGTKYCWCVTRTGVHIKTLGDGDLNQANLNCTDVESDALPVATSPKTPKKGKSSWGLLLSPEDYLNHLSVSAKPTVVPSDPRRRRRHPSTAGESLEKTALAWKFKTLDKKPADDVLKKSELQSLSRLVRKSLSPKKCSKEFPFLCDVDEDKEISKTEWLHCFYTNKKDRLNNGKIAGKNGSGARNSSKSRKGEQLGRCEKEREEEIDSAKNGNMTNHYLPECQTPNRFKPKQCLPIKNVCWCVNVKTGKMIKGTTAPMDAVDCSVVWPKCEQSRKKEKFTKALTAQFNFTVRSRRRATFAKNWDFQRIAEEMFNVFDKNGNGAIEKKEKRMLRKYIKKNKELARCASKIHQICDANEDKEITMPEWVHCVTPRKGSSTTSFGNLLPPPIRKGPSPFDFFLTSEDEKKKVNKKKGRIKYLRRRSVYNS